MRFLSGVKMQKVMGRPTLGDRAIGGDTTGGDLEKGLGPDIPGVPEEDQLRLKLFRKAMSRPFRIPASVLGR